jgi:starch synthase
MLFVIKNAIELYKNKDEWTKVRYNAMTSDFSWSVSAEEYEKLYNK